MKKRWSESNRDKEHYDVKHKNWLDTKFLLPAIFYNLPSSSNQTSRTKGSKHSKWKLKSWGKKIHLKSYLKPPFLTSMPQKRKWHHVLRYIINVNWTKRSYGPKISRSKSWSIASHKRPDSWGNSVSQISCDRCSTKRANGDWSGLQGRFGQCHRSVAL